MKKWVVDAVYERDGYQCRWCGRANPRDLELHHVEIRGMGGRQGRAKETSDHPDNLILLCVTCHDAVHGERTVLLDGHCCDLCPRAWACRHRQLSPDAYRLRPALRAPVPGTEEPPGGSKDKNGL